MCKIKHSILEQLELHEGIRQKPYKDSRGYLTIGIGHNLDAKGLSNHIIKILFWEDMNLVEEKLSEYRWFTGLDEIRKKVILDMGFNLGVEGLLNFKNMISAIKRKDYDTAAVEMLDSRWANQVGIRAKRLSKMMKTGKDYEVY